MKDYIIRLATIEDVKRIQQLSQELLEFEYKNSTKPYLYNMNWALSEDGYNNYKANVEGDWIFVACVDGIIIGYMTCWINKKKPWTSCDIFEIGNIYIQSDYRGEGIGTDFINKAKELCKERQIKHLKVDVMANNKEARAFYAKNGLYDYSIELYTQID